MKDYNRGKNNPTIGMTKEEVTEYWKNKSIEKFGDKYDYSLLGTISTKKDKFQLGCPIHGIQTVSFTYHLKGVGCPKCGDKKGRDSKKLTFEEVVNRIDSVNKDRKYKILSRDIKGRQIKHEKFYVQDEFGISLIGVSVLISGGEPSIKSACFKNLYAERMYRKSIGYKGLHFKDSNYVKSLAYITVRCSKHGEYRTKPNWLISSKRGCPSCYEDRRGLTLRSNTKDFISKSMKRLGTSRDIYDRVEYVHAKHKVSILCKEHNTYYEISPNDHLTGYGCPICGLETGGYSRTDYIKTAKGRQGILYIIRCTNDSESFYKVGITLLSVKKRYPTVSSMPYSYDIEEEYYCDAGCVWDIEKQVIKKFKRFKYEPLIKFQGHTECFSLDLPIEEIKDKYFLHN